MIGRIVGGVLGSAIGKEKGGHSVAGAVIGAATLFAARRLFPQRYAAIAAWGAAGYLTKKWAERAEARKATEAAHVADPAIAGEGVVDPYVGVSDGRTSGGDAIGDALPPAIPAGTGAPRSALH